MAAAAAPLTGAGGAVDARPGTTGVELAAMAALFLVRRPKPGESVDCTGCMAEGGLSMRAAGGKRLGIPAESAGFSLVSLLSPSFWH